MGHSRISPTLGQFLLARLERRWSWPRRRLSAASWCTSATISISAVLVWEVQRPGSRNAYLFPCLDNDGCSVLKKVTVALLGSSVLWPLGVKAEAPPPLSPAWVNWKPFAQELPCLFVSCRHHLGGAGHYRQLPVLQDVPVQCAVPSARQFLQELGVARYGLRCVYCSRVRRRPPPVGPSEGHQTETVLPCGLYP